MGVGCSEYVKSASRGIGSGFAGWSFGNFGRGNGGGEMKLRGEPAAGEGGGGWKGWGGDQGGGRGGYGVGGVE